MQPHSSTFFSLWWAIVRTKTMLQRVDISASTPDAEKYSRNDGSLLWPAWTEKKKSISTLFCEREKKNHLVSFIMMGGKIREIKDIYLKEPALLLLLKKRKKKISIVLQCKDMLNVKMYIRWCLRHWITVDIRLWVVGCNLWLPQLTRLVRLIPLLLWWNIIRPTW